MKLFPNRSKLLGFDDRITILLGIPVIAFIIPPLFFLGTYSHESFEAFLKDWGPGLFFSTILWLGNRKILLVFRKRYLNRDAERQRIVKTLFALILYTTAVNLVGYIGLPDQHPNRNTTGQGVASGLFITLFIVSIYEAIWASYRLRSVKMESEKLKRARVQSQLSALKSQVNPHFLFNSLNTLISIIPDEPESAVKFAQNLSRVYRSILEIRDKEVITLGEELEYIDSYIFLLKTRFGEGLSIDIQLDASAKEKFLVPLALQILFENAIKHNIVSRKRPLRIEIHSSDETQLIFRNNRQLKDQQMESTGTGLENINKRFRIVSQEQIDVIETADHFTVVLPLLTIENYESSNN